MENSVENIQADIRVYKGLSVLSDHEKVVVIIRFVLGGGLLYRYLDCLFLRT